MQYYGRMETISLHGMWKLRSDDGSFFMDGPVPGTALEVFDNNKLMGPGGVNFGLNNHSAVKIAKRGFIYSSTFELGEEHLEAQHLDLVCEGLDTLATIVINGRELAKTENMHRRYRFSLVEFCQTGSNSIEIHFSETLEYVKHKQAERFLITSYESFPELAHRGFNRIRKSHCSYGWDWGPIVPDSGIWRPIYIEAYDHGRIDHLAIAQDHSSVEVRGSLANGTVAVTVTPRVASARDDHGLKAELTVTAPNGNRWTAKAPAGEPLSVTIDRPQLWWPRNLGSQPLYTLEVHLKHGTDTVHSQTKTIGLRTLTVDRSKDQWGERFAFVCNGQDFFAMGADYIPEDVFLTRMNEERSAEMLQHAADANYNCIRVWGGAVYPPGHFYELCDQLGLVVWQDLMFACAMYDMDDPEFAANVAAEVEDNVERIHHHASLGLICGNNENEWAFDSWDEFKAQNTEQTRREYLYQYEELFPEIVKRCAPQIFYWPASPSSGGGFDDANDPDRGDCHYWDVWHGGKPYEEYREHHFRFMSEFGFESMPHYQTVLSYTDKDDRHMESEVVLDHQRGQLGWKKHQGYLEHYYRPAVDFESWIYLSQVSQAEAIRHGVQHWRRNRGRSMGAIYWQFNDNWPVMSWSSVDYYGRWKALHYQAKRDFNPVVLTAYRDGSEAKIYLANEGFYKLSGSLSWQILDCSGQELGQGKLDGSVGGFAAAQLTQVDLTPFLNGGAERGLILSAQFNLGGGDTFNCIEPLMPFKTLALEDPGLNFQLSDAHGAVHLVVSCQKPAFYVEVYRPDAYLQASDNFFHLVPGQNHTIKLTHGVTSDIEEQLRLRSLFQSYTKS